jgi:glutaminase
MADMDFQAILDEIDAELRPLLVAPPGKVASYIPALARVAPGQFGIALRTCAGETAAAGHSAVPFSIQSMSKVFSLTLAIRALDEALWQRIGREPSGSPFNSLVQLETERGIPRNPFINAGAIAVANRLLSHGNGLPAILALLGSLCGEPVGIDPEVAASEAHTGFRNTALANFTKGFGTLDNDTADVLAVYFSQCAIRMDCEQVACAAGYLCRDGRHPLDGSAVISPAQTRRVNALMLTCGTYDAAGEFAFRIGLPEPVQGLPMMPARHPRAAIEARTAGQARAWPRCATTSAALGCLALRVAPQKQRLRRCKSSPGISPVPVCALPPPLLRGNGRHGEALNRFQERRGRWHRGRGAGPAQPVRVVVGAGWHGQLMPGSQGAGTVCREDGPVGVLRTASRRAAG